MCKLTDFTVDQLQTLIAVVEARISDLNEKSHSLNMHFHEGSYTRKELFAMYKKEWDTLQLWNIQLLNAVGEVSNQEKIISN